MTDAATGADTPRSMRRPFISRARLTELGLIVFGVMIALALENAVQELRWRGEARDLEELFRDDIEYNLAVAVERRAVDACLRDQLRLLGSRALAAQGSLPASAYQPRLEHPMRPVLANAYRAPLRTWRTTSFERALGTEAIKRIPRERFLHYANLFTVFGQLGELQNQEYVAAADLTPPAYPVPDFSAEVRADALQAIATVDALRGRLTLVSVQTVENARAFGIEVDRAALERRRLGSGSDRRTLGEILRAQRDGRGACVDVAGSLRLLPRPR